MTAEIISVGTELLLGNILNTNAQYLSRESQMYHLRIFLHLQMYRILNIFSLILM